MSFGFLTESALLPSKSKPIKVDGRSLVDLKAIVYAKEQKVKLDGGGSSSSAGLRGLRGKRSAAGSDANGAARKDPFARSNRGVENRSQRDELDRVTASKKRKAAQRTMTAKASLYEKMAKGEVGGSSQSGSLVDFSRKTGADLALLGAKAGKSKQRRPGSSKTSGRKRQRNNSSGGEPNSDDYDTDENPENSENDDDDDGTSAEITITDEFGRERAVARGGPEHRAYLEAKKAVAEKRAEEKAEIESYDERYSYRGNRGSAAPPSSSSFGGASSFSGARPGAGVTAAAPATAAAAGGGGGGGGGGWAWSSGVGRGADAGDFETRDGQERRAKEGMAELLQREGGDGGGGGEVGRDGGGAKILSQWERTLTGDQKTFLREVQEETAVSRSAQTTDRSKQRLERKELLRQKQEARAARLRGDA